MKSSSFKRFQVLGWIVFILLTLPPKFEVQSSIIDVAGSVLVHDGLCILLTCIMLPVYHQLYHIRQDVVWLGGWTMVLCGTAAALQVFLFYVIGGIFPVQEQTLFGKAPALGIFYFRFGVFLFWSLMYWMMQRAQEEGRIKLNMLRAQMNPHFLSNALGHVIVLIGPQVPKASAMVQALSNYLNYSLRHQKDDFVTLDEEYEALLEYLTVERTYHGQRLDVACQMEPSLEPVKVPGVILQPLMENAIKYGFLTWTPPVIVRLSIRRLATAMLIEVGNTGHWVVPDKDRLFGGIGLDNLRRRLASQYGRRYRLETLVEEGWVTINLKLPLKDYEPNPAQSPDCRRS